jgi:hypothetical protein
MLSQHVACTGEMKYEYNILIRKLNGRDNFDDLCTDGMIILEHILRCA